MDGEQELFAADLVDEHVQHCAGCRSWLVAAESMNRAFRVQSAVPVPDLTAAILTSSAPKWKMPKLPWLRIGLAWVGFAQIVFGIVQMVVQLQTSATPSVALHAFSEGGAWNVAAGCGLMYAAWRTKATVGLLPMLTPFAILVAGVTVYDIVDGAIKPMHIFAHGLLVIGLAFLFFVHRQAQHTGAPEPRSAKAVPDGTVGTGRDPESAGPSADHSGPGRHLRPASRAA